MGNCLVSIERMKKAVMKNGEFIQNHREVVERHIISWVREYISERRPINIFCFKYWFVWTLSFQEFLMEKIDNLKDLK